MLLATGGTTMDNQMIQQDGILFIRQRLMSKMGAGVGGMGGLGQ